MAKKKVIPGEMSIEEMGARLIDLDRELFELRNHLALHKKLDQPHLIKHKRKEKARLLTLLTQKSKGAV